MIKGKRAFIPKARLIQILGEHLIKDATVGLLELAKNSYDADATEVQIQMLNLNDQNGKIIIRDNGSGMDLDTFLNKWMNPAIGDKQNQKVEKKRTQLGRLPLGEKGVGRFAAQQIGNQLVMISKTINSDRELYVEIDWSEFEDYKKDLSEIEISYEQRPLTIFTIKESGTLLDIRKLRSEWKEPDVERLSNSLKRMKSPFKGANDFDVNLKFENCPEEFDKYSNLDLTDVLDKAHYKLFGIVDDNGNFEFEYDFNVPGIDKIHRTDTINLVSSFGLRFDGPLLCGGFIVYLHHYVKKNAEKWLQKSSLNSKDIDELCGVSIYRDGIRILPYGEKGNDWLKLDSKRIQRSELIGNDTIIGMIEINQIENLLLKDKTNREGLIENKAYSQFEKIVFAAIQTLHNEKTKDRPEKKKKNVSDENVEKSIDEVREKLSTAVQQVALSNDEEALKAASLLQTVTVKVDALKKQVEQTVDGYENVNKILFNLAGTGLAAERFTHEFSRLISGANTSLARLKNLIDLSVPKIKKEIDALEGALEALRNDIRLLGPMFYIKKVAKEKTLDVKEIINNTLSLQEHWIKKENVHIEIIGDSFPVTMREGSCMQIFNNLIDNSIYWLSRKTELDNRKVKIMLDSKRKSVYLSDNGPGVVPRYKEKIFDPFFSMKAEDGRGLGLYIVKEILDEKNWDILLVTQEDQPGLLKGAAFKIIFDGSNN